MEKFFRRKVKVYFMRILGNIPPLFLINYFGNPVYIYYAHVVCNFVSLVQ